jgi:F-type H+-transporting ATPase subunit b
MIGGALDKRADQIRNELEEAKKLREEAQQLLAEYQRKRKEAESEAESILSAAEREAAALREDAKAKTEEYVSRRTAMAEQKIRQAEADAINEVRASAVDLAIVAAEKLIASKVDSKVIGRAVQGFAWRSQGTSQLRFCFKLMKSGAGIISRPFSLAATSCFGRLERRPVSSFLIRQSVVDASVRRHRRQALRIGRNVIRCSGQGPCSAIAWRWRFAP